MEKYTLEEIIEKGIIVNCKTEDDANKLLSEAHKIGMKWNTGEGFLDKNNWQRHKEKTCYNLKQGLFDKLYYYKNTISIIIDFNQVDFKEDEKMETEELRNGDWFLCYSYSEKMRYALDAKGNIFWEDGDKCYLGCDLNKQIIDFVKAKPIAIKPEAIKENTVVHCPEEWMSEALFWAADRMGKRWSCGESYIGTNSWYHYKEESCYNFFGGWRGSVSYYKSEGFKIIPFWDAVCGENKESKNKKEEIMEMKYEWAEGLGTVEDLRGRMALLFDLNKIDGIFFRFGKNLNSTLTYEILNSLIAMGYEKRLLKHNIIKEKEAFEPCRVIIDVNTKEDSEVVNEILRDNFDKLWLRGTISFESKIDTGDKDGLDDKAFDSLLKLFGIKF